MAGWKPPARYDAVVLVASGGMGDVYRAVDLSLGRKVALKVLAEHHSHNADVRARFTREGHAAARLSAHPHVVTVFDVGEHDRRPYIVMAYLDGGSVHERIQSARVPVATALEWLRQTASALDTAHASGVVHRDVKPANLMLDERDQLHVTDFGIASAAGLDTLTLPGTIMGTAGYLSPEQARGEPATPASDRYALGVVAYELLTGRRPFEGETPVTVAFAHVNAEVPSAELAEPSLPNGVDAVLRRALAKEPSARPTSATEFVDDLREAIHDSEPTTVVQPAAAAVPAVVAAASTRGSPPLRRRLRATLVPLAAVGLLGAGLAAAAFVSADGDPPRERTVTRVRTTVSTVSDTASTFTVTETTTAPSRVPESGQDGASLNDAGFELMREGEFDEALPLLEQAVADLAGSGTLAEAYASYNLAFTRFALGRCDGVLELLDRSEAVQGRRPEIDRLRRDAERNCENGRGNGSGRGNDDGDD
jgi:eukaryotic-like serine/threonine-protein kinase